MHTPVVICNKVRIFGTSNNFMTKYRKYILILLPVVIFFIYKQKGNKAIDSTQLDRLNSQAPKVGNVVPYKTDYELADEFLQKLRNDKVDSIIFYKRTCIDCCDFYNIFWKEKGQAYLTKFDTRDLETRSQTIALSTNTIFEVLANSYTELKTTSIKENEHKRKDGTATCLMATHYCYAQMSIYIRQDSIITDRMKDHDFDKYTDFGEVLPGVKGKRETNDNYTANINSKWNSLMIVIEKQIASMAGTSERELETLRTIGIEEKK